MWTNLRLVNWLSSVSPLLWACLVLLFSQAGFLIFGLKKLKSLRNLSLMKRNKLSAYSSNSASTEDSCESNGSLDIPSTPRVAAALMVALFSAVLLFMAASRQRGQCSATGDFFESDSMQVQGPADYPNSWNVMGKDNRVYRITFCATSPNVSLHKGDVILYAKYEYRDGCLDFSSQQAALQIK